MGKSNIILISCNVLEEKNMTNNENLNQQQQIVELSDNACEHYLGGASLLEKLKGLIGTIKEAACHIVWHSECMFPPSSYE